MRTMCDVLDKECVVAMSIGCAQRDLLFFMERAKILFSGQ